MRRVPLLLLALATTACGDSPDPTSPLPEAAMAAVPLEQYNEREDWSMVLPYDCAPPSELVQLTGQMHTVSMMRLDATDDQHWSFHSNPIRMSGVGLSSGREFKVVGAESTTRIVETDGHRRFRQTAILRLMSHGEPVWTVRFHLLRERTPPGPWVYTYDHSEITCS